MYGQFVFKVKTAGLLNIICICQFVEHTAKPISFIFLWRGEEHAALTPSPFIWEGSVFAVITGFLLSQQRENAQTELIFFFLANIKHNIKKLNKGTDNYF